MESEELRQRLTNIQETLNYIAYHTTTKKKNKKNKQKNEKKIIIKPKEEKQWTSKE